MNTRNPAAATPAAIDEASAAAEWAEIAPRLAARGRIRISRDGGRTYPVRGERAVTTNLPNQPAAVLLFDHQGCAPVLVFDLDSSRGDVDHDLQVLTNILTRCDATSTFSDHSPNGGRHVYVPLASPVPVGEVVQLMAGLRTLLPTLDHTPMTNPVAGCIRPPGARHRTGGHQRLHDTVQAATAALDAPNGLAAWAALQNEAAQAREARADRPSSSSTTQPGPGAGGELDPLPALPGYDGLSAKYLAIARTGDTSGYTSPSEARQAVMWAATASGWALPDVLVRMADGTWPGLASLYARYTPATRTSAIRRDWHKAHQFEKQRRERHHKDSVRLRTTSPHKTHRGSPPDTGLPRAQTVNQQVRVWLAAVEILAQATDDLAYRAVLYALAEAAALTDSMVLAHGNRSLAIAAGLDQASVGRILNTLADQPPDRALIQRLRPATATTGATYQLVIPHHLVERCEAAPWRRGRIHATRPVFRALGLPSAFIYAALEQLDSPTSGRELARAANLGVTATYDALAALAAWGLAVRTPTGWTRGRADLVRAAERVGAIDDMRAQIDHYYAERLAWRLYLGIEPPRGSNNRAHPAFGPAPPPLPEHDLLHRPPDPGLVDLLERELGAQLLDQPGTTHAG